MQKISQFDLDIIQSALKAISDEMFLVVKKTAMSPIIYEILDMGVGIADKQGNLLTSGAGIPAFVGMLERSIKTVLNHFGVEAIKDQDIYLINDPYNGGVTHLNDIIIIKPVFYKKQFIGFTANIAHFPDIGGMVPGGISSDAIELYQEGLILPPIKLYEQGQLNQSVFDIIMNNTRMPTNVKGDLSSCVASVDIGYQRLVELLDKFSIESFEIAVKDLLDFGERSSLKALKELPKGSFKGSDILDDGREIKVTITISNDEFIVDLRDNPAQSTSPNNASKDGVIIASQMLFKAITTPNLDSNAGSYRPLKVFTKKGTMFDPSSRVACAFYYEVDQRVNDLIWKTIFPYVTDKLTVGHFSSICGTFFGGINPDNQSAFTIVEPQIGGWGASCDNDGVNALFSSSHGDTFNCPAEIAEARYGVFVKELALNDESGGEGQFRGGKGICLSYIARSDNNWLTVGYSRSVTRPWGFNKGCEGSKNYVKVIRTNGSEEHYYQKSGIKINKGDIIEIRTANGAGFGDPKLRPKDKVLEDLKNGYISEQTAKTIYKIETK